MHRLLISAVPPPTWALGMACYVHLLLHHIHKLQSHQPRLKCSGLRSGRTNRPTMPSADFCVSIPSSLDDSSSWQAHRSPRVMHTCLHAYARRVYAHAFRAAIGLQRYTPSYPACTPDAIPVRRASTLPAASFRLHLTMTALAVQLTVPAAGPVEDLHLQACVPCRAHI